VPNVASRFKIGQRVWVEVEGHSKREIVHITGKALGEDGVVYYRVSYVLGTQAEEKMLQGFVAEKDLGTYYG
jgi:hypothetical protein